MRKLQDVPLRTGRWLVVALAWAAAPLDAIAAADGPNSGLCIRLHTGSNWAAGQHWIPKGAVSVFTYEGRPRRVCVTEKHIACDYGVSGVLFDVATGKMVRRYTHCDGWPQKRPQEFGPRSLPGRRRAALVNPGVVPWRQGRKPGDDPKKSPLAVAAEVTFRGRTFRAMQLALGDILRAKGVKAAREGLGQWGGYLSRSGERSCIEATGDGKTRRYTTVDGLAGNIVSHLAVSGDVLWAACVDVYDHQKKAWGPGGLCRYDPDTDRWVHVKAVDGKPVRWVSLLEAHGDELWVGFRQGQGITGTRIMYGMGLYPGLYRPKATAIVLARLKGGKWAAWSRKPRPEGEPRSDAPGSPQPAPAPPTEIPRRVASLSSGVLVYSTTRSRYPSGNFQLPMDGHVSLLDLGRREWRDFSLPRLLEMHVERGEVIVLGETTAHQWDAKRSQWRRLETHCTLRNPAIQAVTPVGDEVWVGYTAQSYFLEGVQGLSRYNTRTGQWTHLSPKELGTSCGVRVIAADRDGCAWVLFGSRRWYMAAAMDIPRSSDPSGVKPKPGVGRFAEGKWTFPVKLAGVSDSIERSRRGPDGTETWKQALPIQDLAAAGGAVFVANQLGVYAGPGQWRRIYEGEVVRIWPSDDGRELLLVRYDPKRSGTEESKHDLGRYDPKTGKLAFRPIKSGEFDIHRLRTGEFFRYDGFPSSAVRLPAKKPGNWYAMPLNTDGRVRLIETRAAFWIATPGQLIRLDRTKLPDWVGR